MWFRQGEKTPGIEARWTHSTLELRGGQITPAPAERAWAGQVCIRAYSQSVT